MIRPIAALLLILATTAAAQEESPVTPGQFRTYSQGWTLFFESETAPGVTYGAEQYLDNDQVIWRFGDGDCARGSWRPDGQALCFTYENAPDQELCWGVYRDSSGYYARLLGGGDNLRITRRTRQPLNCPGPNVGV